MTSLMPEPPALLPVASTRQVWSWLRGELRRRWLAITGTVVIGLFGAAGSVIPIYVLGILVDRVREGAPRSAILSLAVVIVAASVVAGAAVGLSHFLISRLGGEILATLRENTMSRALSMPAAILERAGKGDLLSRVGADVAAIGKAVSDVIPTMVSSFLLGVMSVAAMAGLDWRLGLAGLLAFPLHVVALRWYLPRSAPGYAQERRTVAERSQLLVESLQGVSTVRAYRLEDRHLRKIDEVSARTRDVSVGVFSLFTRFVGRVNRAEFTGLAAILVVGFLLVRNGSVSVGQTAAAAVLFHRLFNPISMLLYTFDDVQAAGAGLARLVGVTGVPAGAPVGMPAGVAVGAPAGVPVGMPAGVPAWGGKPIGESAQEGWQHRVPADTSLELVEVRFSYDGVAPVLHGVSLRVDPGSRVALVGSTGAGKSTLAVIAAGGLSPDSGAAFVGGVPLAHLDPALLSSSVAIISQETHVFAGPLIEDLRLARPSASTAEVDEALSVVGAREWVNALPDGVATVVGEGGHELTPAQAQQLALARLVLLDPAVVILDEATAEAGSLGARVLEESAAAATEGRTTLVVAHRLTQAASADRVVVLEGGQIVEEGSHDELVSAGGRYGQLWRAWETRTPATSI
jgi:ATP-binding cassette subfamily C protein